MENEIKTLKLCAVRLDAELHRKAKLKAYELGITLQDYIKILIENDMKKSAD